MRVLTGRRRKRSAGGDKCFRRGGWGRSGRKTRRKPRIVPGGENRRQGGRKDPRPAWSSWAKSSARATAAESSSARDTGRENASGDVGAALSHARACLVSEPISGWSTRRGQDSRSRRELVAEQKTTPPGASVTPLAAIASEIAAPSRSSDFAQPTRASRWNSQQ